MLYSILILEFQTATWAISYKALSISKWKFHEGNAMASRWQRRRVETETGNALVSKQVCCLVSQNRIIDQPLQLLTECTVMILWSKKSKINPRKTSKLTKCVQKHNFWKIFFKHKWFQKIQEVQKLSFPKIQDFPKSKIEKNPRFPKSKISQTPRIKNPRFQNPRFQNPKKLIKFHKFPNSKYKI